MGSRYVTSAFGGGACCQFRGAQYLRHLDLDSYLSYLVVSQPNGSARGPLFYEHGGHSHKNLSSSPTSHQAQQNVSPTGKSIDSCYATTCTMAKTTRPLPSPARPPRNESHPVPSSSATTPRLGPLTAQTRQTPRPMRPPVLLLPTSLPRSARQQRPCTRARMQTPLPWRRRSRPRSRWPWCRR